jgi:hypothetical protein
MTNYNEAINYNAPINYNGVTTPPAPSPVIAGGFVLHDYHRKPKTDDDFAIALLLELLDDD